MTPERVNFMIGKYKCLLGWYNLTSLRYVVLISLTIIVTDMSKVSKSFIQYKVWNGTGGYEGIWGGGREDDSKRLGDF